MSADIGEKLLFHSGLNMKDHRAVVRIIGMNI